MDNDYENEGCFGNLFRTFVCVTLSLLLGLQVYSYLWGSQDLVDGDFSDIKHVVMQLTHGLSEVSRKHERLQGEMERISAELPAVAAAAGRAKDALEPARRNQQHSLETRDYDRQLADYALETAGARIMDTGDTIEHVIYESVVGWVLHAVSSALCRDCLGAAAIIRPGTLPGECWAFKGSRGEATIRLLGTVRIKGISVEHIPAHISPTRTKIQGKVPCLFMSKAGKWPDWLPDGRSPPPIDMDIYKSVYPYLRAILRVLVKALKHGFGEISSAPRLFQLEGLEYRSDQYPHDFGTYEYDKEAKPIQYFEVNHPSTKAYNLVRFRVLSNWGHSVYTCVYRIRVHGDLAPGQTPSQTLINRDGQDLRIENE